MAELAQGRDPYAGLGVPESGQADPYADLGVSEPSAPDPYQGLGVEAEADHTLGSTVNLAARGAFSEGLLPMAQGVAGGVARFEENEDGTLRFEPTINRVTGAIDESWIGNTPGGAAASAYLKAFRDTRRKSHEMLTNLAGNIGKARELVREATPVDEPTASSFLGQTIQAFGQAATTLPIYLIPGVGPVAGAAGSAGQIYQEGFDDALGELQQRQLAGEIEMTDAEMQHVAHRAGMEYLPASTLDVLGDRLVIGRILKPFKGKVTVGRLLKEIGARGAGEGVTEGAQQAWLNTVAAHLEGYDPDRAIDDEVIRSATIGAIVGTTVTGGVETWQAHQANKALEVEALTQQQEAAAAAQRIARESARIAVGEMRAAEEGELLTPDNVADAQAAIIDKTRAAQQALQRAEEVSQDATQKLEMAITSEAELEAAIETDPEQETQAENTLAALSTATEADILDAAIIEASDPYGALAKKYPEQAQFVETDERAVRQGRLLIEMELEDGTRIPATFAGYWAGMPGDPPMIGYFSERGLSDGMPLKNSRILTPIPSIEEWTAGVQQAQEAANALQVEETGEVPSGERAGSVRALEEEVQVEREPAGAGAQETGARAQAAEVRSPVLRETAREVADRINAQKARTQALAPERQQRVQDYLERVATEQNAEGEIIAPAETTIAIQRFGGEAPDYVQVDLNDLTLPPDEQNLVSLNPATAEAAGIRLPAIPDDLPAGRYMVDEIRAETERRLTAGREFEAMRTDEGGFQMLPEQQQMQRQDEPLERAEAEPDGFEQAAASEQDTRARAKAKRLARVGLPANGEPDLLNVIQEMGGVPAPRPNAGGEYDGFREAFSGVALNLVNTRTPGSKFGAGGIDTFIETLAEMGYRFDGPDAFYEAVNRAKNTRVRLLEAQVRANKTAQFEQSLLANEKNAQKRVARQAISSDDLGVGDSFRVDGERVVVTAFDPDTGELTIQDGITYRLADGTEIYPDKGTLRRVKRDVDVIWPDEFAAPQTEPAAPQTAAPAPQTEQAPVTPDEGFELAAPTELELATEQDAQRQRQQAETGRAELLARAEAPLTGDNSGVGQGVLFAGDEDLFSGVSQEAAQTVGPASPEAIEAVQSVSGQPAPVSVPVDQTQPATTIANRDPADVSTESLESIEAEGLMATVDDPTEGPGGRKIVTQIFGKIFGVLGRRQLNEAERFAARQRANNVFLRAGLNVVWDPQNEVYRLAQPNTPQEVQGRRLLEILREEFGRGVDSSKSPLLYIVVNSVRNPDGGLWKSPAFSPETQRQMFSLAQGEASFYGLMLGALAKAKRTLSFVAENVEVVLHKAYSTSFGGDAIQRILDRTRRATGDELADDIVSSPERVEALEALDTEEVQRSDLEQFVAQLLEMSPNGLRITARPADNALDTIIRQFPLAQWRARLRETGAADLYRRLIDRLRGASSESEVDPESGEVETPEGEVEPGVKRMDRLLQREFRAIIAEVLRTESQTEAAPRDRIGELATARGDVQTAEERIARLDQLIEQELEARQQAEIEENPGVPADVIEAKYDAMRDNYAEIAQTLRSRISSSGFMRGLVHEQVAQVFETRGARWSQFATGQRPISELRQAVLESIRSRLAEINAQAPEAALSPEQTSKIVDAAGVTFDEIAAKKRAAYAARPQRTAENALNRLARLHSDVQEWGRRREDLVSEAITAQRQKPKPADEFIDRLKALGVQDATARSLSTIMEHDRAIVERLRYLGRLQSMASPRPEVPPGQERVRAGIKPLVDQILSAPPEQQNDPRWRRRIARDYFVQNGMTAADADAASAYFGEEYAQLIEQARRRAFESERQKLTRREARALGRSVAPRRQLWERIERAVNAGIFDNSQVIEQLARDYGWNVPTDAQKARLRELSVREQNLRRLSEDERAQIGDDPRELQVAEMEKAAATKAARLAIRREMQTLWARFSRPIAAPFSAPWRRDANVRQNTSVAISEFLSANMLLKLGFGTKQIADVFCQSMIHVPSRAVAHAMQRHYDRAEAGQPANLTEAWTDFGSTLSSAYAQMVRDRRLALDQFIEGFQGRTVERNVEGLLGAVSSFDRMRLRADELQANGQFVRAGILRIIGLAELSFRFARSLDAIQGVVIERQETMARVISELEENGLSPEDARANAKAIIGDLSAEMQLAVVRAKDILDQQGESYTPAELRAAGYEVYKSRQYARMQGAGLPAADISEDVRILRQTNGWNLPELLGLGGVLGAGVRATGRALELAGMPLPIGRFANAIAIGVNRALTFTPLGFFPSLFGGDQNYWFRTDVDRLQRKVEATIGTSMGTMLAAAAFAGLIRVWNQAPDDPEERELWERAGHKAGTVEFMLPGGSFFPLPLSSGPMAYLRGPLGGIGHMQDAVDRRNKARARFAERALRTGETVGEIPEVNAADLVTAGAWGMGQAVFGGRTAGGLVRSFTGEDRLVPQAKRFIASQASPFVPGLPGYQELVRGMGVRLDPRFASIWEFLAPFPGTDSARRNFLNDPITRSTTQSMIQTLTGGAYGVVDPREVEEMTPYRILNRTLYRPGAIGRTDGFVIDGMMRPLDDAEYLRVTRLRGSIFKQQLMAIDENVDDQMLEILVRDAAGVAREQALAIGAGAQSLTDPEAEDVREYVESIPEQAALLHRQLRGIPADQWQARIQQEIAAGRIPMQGSQPDPAFVMEFNRLVQPAPAR